MPGREDIREDERVVQIHTFEKIYANTNTSNLKKVVLDVPAVRIGETTGNFTIVSDTDILDYFYQGLLSFRFGAAEVVNPDRFINERTEITTSCKTTDGDLYEFTFEKVDDPDYNYKYNAQFEITTAESSGSNANH